MKPALTICFVFWCLITLLLALSLVGLILLVREDHDAAHYQGEEGESAWLKLGKLIILNLIK